MRIVTHSLKIEVTLYRVHHLEAATRQPAMGAGITDDVCTVEQ